MRLATEGSACYNIRMCQRTTTNPAETTRTCTICNAAPAATYLEFGYCHECTEKEFDARLVQRADGRWEWETTEYATGWEGDDDPEWEQHEEG